MLNLKKIISVLVLVASMATIMPMAMVASASGYGMYNVLYPKMNANATSINNTAVLEWDSLSGLGDTFDKYNILFKKGYYNELTGDVAKAYVDWNYYYLTGLTPGDWWTFQVVPVEFVNGKYIEVGENVFEFDPAFIGRGDRKIGLSYPNEGKCIGCTKSGKTVYEVELAGKAERFIF